MEIWEWLLEFFEQVELPFSEAFTVGNGPIQEETFDTFLRKRGLNVQDIYNDVDVDTLIVGREEWNPEGLNALIDSRRGQTLKVYSQEMLLSYLMTAQDPYDSPAILSTFAEGHAALEYLRDEGFHWPTTTAVPSAKTGSFSLESSPKESALTALGYKTGLSAPGPQDRRAILKRAFEKKLPFVNSEEYMDGWGSPKSSKRLQKMANTMAATVRNHKRNRTRDMSMAINEREADLEWLYKTYYVGRFRFIWPSTEVE